MPLNLDPEVSQKLNDSMKSGDAIELPFPVVYIWTVNGQPAYKSVGGALYHGGWACKAEELEAAAQQQGLTAPNGWARGEIVPKDGDPYEAYTSRSVVVAPFGRRESWIDQEGRRSTHYVDGARHHVQVLAYLAEKTKNDKGQTTGYVPWGPVVLSAKGYQARNLTDAFKVWSKALSEPIRKYAPGVPAWCFYLALGTFEKERKAVMVGKGAQSPITPIGVYVPPGEITEAQLTALFIGNDLAHLMVDYQDRAAEWLGAWAAPAPAAAQDDGYEPPMNGEPTDEAPF